MRAWAVLRAGGQPVPSRVVVGGRDRAAAPGMPPQLHRDLEDGEPVGPGREAAGATVAVELAGHRDHRVVGGLAADVLELGAADLGVEMAAAIGLAVRGAEQQVVQALQRQGAPGPCRPQAVEPGARFDVELIDLCALRSHRRGKRSHAA